MYNVKCITLKEKCLYILTFNFSLNLLDASNNHSPTCRLVATLTTETLTKVLYNLLLKSFDENTSYICTVQNLT